MEDSKREKQENGIHKRDEDELVLRLLGSRTGSGRPQIASLSDRCLELNVYAPCGTKRGSRVQSRRQMGQRSRSVAKRQNKTENKAVLDTCLYLEQIGFVITYNLYCTVNQSFTNIMNEPNDFKALKNKY